MARQIQKSLKPSETENFKLLIHAGDRNRTGTVSLQQDFKSCASASSATPAYMIMGRGGFEPPKQVAADLQSVPFGHSGICPFITKQYKIDLLHSSIT